MGDTIDLDIFTQCFRNLFREAPFSAALFSGDDLVIEMANEASLKLWGKDSSIIGKKLLEGIPEVKDQHLYQILRDVYATGETYEGNERSVYIEIGGMLKKHYVNLVYKPVRDEDNKIMGVLGVGYDVTDQVTSRLKLQELEERTRLAIESTGLGTFDLNYKTGDIFTSERFGEIFGYTEPRPRSDYIARVHPEDRARREAAQQKALKTGKLFYEVRLLMPDGSIRWVRINGAVIFDEARSPVRLIGTVLDMTDEKQAISKLQESEERFRTLITETPEVGVGLYLGREIRIQYVNDVMLHFWGKDHSVIGKTMLQALPELEGQPFLEQLDQVFTTGVPFTGKGVAAWLESGGKLNKRYFNYTYKALRDRSGEIYAIHHMAVDVTEQVINKLEVEKNEKRLQDMANSMPQLVWIANEEGTVTYYNNRINEFAGAKKNENGTWTWQGMIHPDDFRSTIHAWHNAVKNLTIYQVEHRILMRDGTYRWHLSRAYAYQGDGDGGIKWYGTATDVHDQKVMEMNLEKSVRERTLELQRSNDDLQQFAHVASHDLKEPIRKIKTFSHRLRDEYQTSLGDKGNTFVSKIIQSTDRMYSMINGVLNYSAMSSTAGPMEIVDLNSVIRSIQTDLEILIHDKKATIIFHELPLIKGLPDLIYQLFYNLINNSLKFSKENIPAEIEITSHPVEANGIRYAEIVLTDNGIGFDEDHAEQIFVTFFRLNSKDKYEGTGLGLALCKKIVERHGGTIYARGQKDKGAQFVILLPE